jgi:hypothetical protein
MADDRAALLAKLDELDKKEMGAEQKRVVARLHRIRMEAAEAAVLEEASDGPVMTALNMAEEAAQLGVRLAELQVAEAQGS